MRKTKGILLIILFLCITMITASCTQIKKEARINVERVIKASDLSKIPQKALQRKDSLIVATGSMAGIFNPLYAYDINDVYANELLFDSLVEFDEKGNPIEALADYKMSSDGLVYTFDLKNAKFSDGTALSSDDVEFTFLVMADSSYTGMYMISSLGIKGVDEYYNGEAQTISGIKKVNKSTVEITLTEPNSTFLYNMDFGILSKKYYGASYKQGDTSSIEALFDKPMGTGQYILKEYKDGVMAEFSANQKYYRGKPQIETVILTVTAAGDELSKLELGDADVTIIPATESYVSGAEKAGFIDLYRYPSNSFSIIGFNHANAFLSDKAVRQAIAYASNRKAVINQVFGQFASVINIPESKLSWAYTNEGIKSYDFDLQKAEQVLIEAGYTKGSDGFFGKDGKVLELTFSASSNEVTDVLLPVMKDNFNTLGIKLNVETMDSNTLDNRVMEGTVDLWFWGLGMTADPGAIGDLFITQGSFNYLGYSNVKLDEWYQKGRTLSDPSERKNAYAEAYRIINEELPCLPVYQRDDLFLISGRVMDVTVSPYRSIFADLYQVTLSK